MAYRRRGMGQSNWLCSWGILSPTSATCTAAGMNPNYPAPPSGPGASGVTSAQLQEIQPGTPGTQAASDILASQPPASAQDWADYLNQVQDFFSNVASNPANQPNPVYQVPDWVWWIGGGLVGGLVLMAAVRR